MATTTASKSGSAPKKPTLPKSAAGKKGSSAAAGAQAAASGKKPKSAIAKKKKRSVEETEQTEQTSEVEARGPRVYDERKRRKKAKLVGLRKLAQECGYNNGSNGDIHSAAGMDGTHCLITLSDAKRLTRFIPASPDKISYYEDEFTQRQAVSKLLISSEGLRQTQARCDYALKMILNQAAVRCGETNAKQITPAIVQSVLRPYASRMHFTAVVPPLGLVREAQRQGVLDYPDLDKNKAEVERETCKKIKELIASSGTAKTKSSAGVKKGSAATVKKATAKA